MRENEAAAKRKMKSRADKRVMNLVHSNKSQLVSFNDLNEDFNQHKVNHVLVTFGGNRKTAVLGQRP